MHRCLLLLCFTLSVRAADQPNILFIFTDDHATQSISAYGSKIMKTPHLDRLAKKGMLFKRCLVSNSICAPSRAVVLTGKYSHLNGQRTNKDTFDGGQQTAPKLMRKAGYQTAIVGKWHLKSAPTGFDHYEVLKGQGSYYNPMLITNGKNVKHTGYTTDIVVDRTIEWLDKRDKSKPFFLMSQHKAPHGRWEPALRHLTMFENDTIPEPETLFDDYQGRGTAASLHKMGILQHMGDHRLMIKYSSKFTPEQLEAFDGYYRPKNEAFLKADMTDRERTKWHYQRYIKNYLRCVKAVDENVGRLLDYLDENGLSENTIVIYSSDQGFYLGEHGWFDKRWIYEESLRTPLIVRWPGVTTGTQNRDIVSNVDFAEMFLEIAGATVPGDMQGRSLVPLLKGRTPADWRKTFYYEYFESGGHGVSNHYGVVDSRYKLIHFKDKGLDEWELYDLKKDPQELTSVYDRTDYRRVQKRLGVELSKLRKELKVE
ncbi:MAG: sulfatase [Verrucomicrobiales bacterium]|nr:sulfatase [Verrucomicrobiales bacterium]|tara:strand:+ start:397 stop:1848 length:1452 start_codon:yes stop_codon:yes gene_type:complete